MKCIDKFVLTFQMCEDMKVGEKDDMRQLIMETKHLLNDCKSKYDNEKYR